MSPNTSQLTDNHQIQDNYKRFFENALGGFYRKTEKGKFLDVNPALVNMLCYDSADDFITSMNDSEDKFYVDSLEREEIEDILRNRGFLDHFETQAYCKDGSVIWISESARMVVDEATKERYYEGFVEDISKLKGDAWALGELEEKYRNIFENAIEGLFQYTTQGRFVVVNNAMPSLLGYESIDEVLNCISDIGTQVFADSEAKNEFERQAARYGVARNFETRFRRKNGAIIWVLLNARVIKDVNDQPVLFEGSIIDITEKKKAENLLSESLDKISNLFLKTVGALAKTLEIRDVYTAGHQEKVSLIGELIASRMNLDKENVTAVKLSGLLHDIGKISIPQELLSKPGRLTDCEMAFFREHPATGYEILKSIPFPWPIAEIVLQHHERVNGSGYPKKLTGGEILLEARIIGVADVLDAIAADRPYRPALGMAVAIRELTEKKGILYDSPVVEAALSLEEEILKIFSSFSAKRF